MLDGPICKVCTQLLTGLDLVFSDSGAGVAVSRCPRCHNTNHHLDEVTVRTFAKQAGLADELKKALNDLGPAVAALGAWDVMEAYSQFKTVLRNTLRQQQRGPLYNPFYSSGAQVVPSRSRLECVGCGHKWKGVTGAAVECPQCHGYDVQQTPESEGKGVGESQTELTWMRNVRADLEKKADGGDWADNHAFKPREEVEHVVNQEPRHFGDVEEQKEAKIALSKVQEFLQAIIPHVVQYAMERQDPYVLQALGHLGTVIREARKCFQQAREQESADYERTYLVHPGVDLDDLSQ